MKTEEHWKIGKNPRESERIQQNPEESEKNLRYS